MRIISQDGCTDIPYERYTIHYNEEIHKIIAYENLEGEDCIAMGKYSSKDKALKVMGQILTAYDMCETSKINFSDTRFIPNFFFQMPKDTEVAE